MRFSRFSQNDREHLLLSFTVVSSYKKSPFSKKSWVPFCTQTRKLDFPQKNQDLVTFGRLWTQLHVQYQKSVMSQFQKNLCKQRANECKNIQTWINGILPQTIGPKDHIFFLLWMSPHMSKINMVAQFSLDILLIQYWELLSACPGITDQSHMHGLNQIDVSLDV